ncbi:MAG: TIGR03936 family radical SAM-associated protein [Peptostreptococcaceae bacterium]|nr:TIGR03936 family radical SAM-associated protein [Peptostreptococcaceae bacterium]
MIIRCKYAKLGEISFISHLDLLRIFIRALRRENINVNYSQGFHPHPKMSFSPALSLGVESICEYVDIDIADEIGMEEFQNRLNHALPRGVEITHCEEVSKLGGMTVLSSHSQYEFHVEHLDEKMNQALEKVLGSEEIVIEKRNKKGKMLAINVRDRIVDAFVKDGKIYATLLNSTNGAMKPAEFMQILSKEYGEEIVPERIIKINLYSFDGKEYRLV